MNGVVRGQPRAFVLPPKTLSVASLVKNSNRRRRYGNLSSNLNTFVQEPRESSRLAGS